ncbi:MAG: hypothetical protein HYW24_01290 [Candidatus Aenigmarchaeota archaeon]|nr:hypothetical protein [Candidatus Aenigmarchaeota archaeon]
MRKDALLAFGLVSISFLLLFILFSYEVPTETLDNATEIVEPKIQKSDTEKISFGTVMVKLPAVDNEGNGVVATLKVQAIPGEGRILTNVDNILFWVDTQYSIRVADIVAENITGEDLLGVDLIYTIETDASVIEGQSAGAAMTIATIALIENKTLPENVMITGTINPDGTIGPVGAILAKAKASKDVGAEIFLVPKGQGKQTNYRPEKKCEQVGSITICTTEYKAERFDISSDAGIEVKEVSTINEALKYFIS